jgi:hypothetical protein
MKTTGTQRKKRIFVFSMAVIVSCLLSILVPHASERESAIPVISPDQWSSINKAEPEAGLEVENWMLNFHNE